MTKRLLACACALALALVLSLMSMHRPPDTTERVSSRQAVSRSSWWPKRGLGYGRRAPQEPPKASKRPTTPRKPTAAPQRPSAPSYAPGSIQALLVKLWPGDDRVMLCIVGKETGHTWNPNIKSPGGTYWGLFQANSDFRATYGFGWSVAEQVAMAWRGFKARGWNPWPTRAGC